MILSLLLALTAHAAETPAIDQAQALAKKKNRAEACSVLEEAILKSPPGHKSRAKLLDSLQQISKMFFTDKGQKEFEAGQAIMWDSPDMALSHLKTALANEDKNLLILNNIVRIQLMKQECDAATEAVSIARKMNSFASETAILELRTFLCQKNFAALREKSKSIVTSDKWEEAYVQYLLSQEAIQSQNWKKAFETLIKVTEEQPQFPEAHYWLAKAGDELERDTESEYQRYVSLCKALTVKEKRRFSLEPRLCLNQKEAEDVLVQKSK